MKSAGDSLEQMLKRHVSSDYYQMARETYCIEVKELEKGSEALVKFLLPPRSEGIELTLHKRGFSFLLKSQNADGSFLVRHPETGEVDAHSPAAGLSARYDSRKIAYRRGNAGRCVAR